MDQDDSDEFSEFLITRPRSDNVKSYSNTSKKAIKKEPEEEKATNKNCGVKEALTTKKAVELLLNGSLKHKVCRYCLNVSISVPLYELDEVFQIGGQGTLYKVTVRDMIASFYPFKMIEDPNFPNRICDKCLDTTISSYLFTQQCERSGRALRNCFDDIYEKLDKLDPLDPPKKRGRQKLHPNNNTLYTEHEKVINYANPIINLINRGIEVTEDNKNKINELECPKCSVILPNIESLLNHERMHPKNMWFNCRLCGKAYPKRHMYRKHIKTVHVLGEQLTLKNNHLKCTDCGMTSDVYYQHLQHIEKHKFQMIMEHLIERRMDKLCVVCMGKGIKMVDLNKTVSLHGGCPELTGQRNLYNILASTMPEMNVLHTYTGTKVCEKCFDHALTSYVFLNQAHYNRNRLNTCVNLMLDNLDKINDPCGKIFIEISQDVILPDKEPDIDESLLIEENEEFDEEKLSVEVLEDEFRLKSDSDDSEIEQTVAPKIVNNENCSTTSEKNALIKNSAKNDKKTHNRRKYKKRKLVNGLQPRYERNETLTMNNICSEFLTFRKKRKPVRKFYKCKYTCPLCNKHFISDYFLRKHILRHIAGKVECKICTMQFKSKFCLYEHMRIVHLLGNNSYYSCVNCARTFVTHSKLLAHSKTHLNKECHLCDKIFISQTHYNNHMQRHRVKLTMLKERHVQTCSFCEKACSNDNELSVHVNKVHLQIKPYSCDMCEKQFYTEANMSCHKRVHSMFSKESCTFCNKVLKSRMELVIHVRKHIGVKPYCCQICLQSFYSQTKLKSHLRVSHGGQFCCKLCKTVFVSKSGLKDHINRVHNII